MALGGRNQAGEHREGGAFPRTVQAQQAEHFARRSGAAYALHNLVLTEVFVQTLSFNRISVVQRLLL